MHTHQPRQHVDDPRRANAAGDVDGQALVGEFIDHCQALELLAIGAGIKHEIVGPDVIGRAWWQWTRPTRRNPSSRSFAWQSQFRLTPQPASTVDAHEQPLSPQEDANPPIAISRILCRKPPHRGQRRRILDRLAQSVTHDRTRNAQQPTSSSLRQTMFPDEADLFAPGLWAYHFF